MQNKAIRIIEWSGNRVSCRNLLNELQILPLTSKYMLSFLMFVVQNKTFFSTKSENHNLDIRQRNNWHLPQANLTICQKGTYYFGIKVLIIYPWRLRMLLVTKKFKTVLKKFLYTYSFYKTWFVLFMYYNHKLLYVFYCWDSFCTMPVFILWQVQYPLWWISGILNK